MNNSSNQPDSRADLTAARLKAAKILADKSSCPPFKEVESLVKDLKGGLDFGLARKLIAEVKPTDLKPEESVWLIQQLTLCIYSAAKLKAAKILADKSSCTPFKEFKSLVKDLKGGLDFGLTRKLIAEVRPADLEAGESVWLTQQLALCTYKDEELLPSERFAQALELLKGVGLPPPNKDNPAIYPPDTLPETLALGGAVYKRMFESDGQLENLHNSLSLYRAAWKQDPKKDMGYGGVNAAYVLDLLASRLELVARRTGMTSDEAKRLREEARKLRKEMAEALPVFAMEIEEEEARAGKPVQLLADQYWYAVTLAEIHMGLSDYPNTAKWLTKARQIDSVEWEKQTTFRQLLTLARVQEHCPPPPDETMKATQWREPWKTLAQFLETGAEEAFSCWRGKVGLALSGGGFRASFFHLGVLARLAEMDVLRCVEVLSTVSGGSIVGAHYYLEVQNLLKTREDGEITREDYIDIVRSVQEQFLKGVQQNLRTRVMTNLGCTLKMLRPAWMGSGTFTRSHRLGELYEEALYASVRDRHTAGNPRTMPSLLIQPKGEMDGETFRPKFSNWRRRAKVPVLLLNSTSLNSGHNWQFTGSWMGEPPGLMGKEVNLNARYRRLYYSEAPTQAQQNFRLGHAVAASACVPGMFEPLEIAGLYPGRTVRLVDGGVHDNQGVAGLLDESCTFILCSDACGQMGDEASPANGTLGVPMRSNSILMDRVREAEYQDLEARVQNRALQGLFFIHMKQDLVPAGIDWIGCQEPGSEPPVSNTTPYGVDRDIQRKLAGIRTDLDSFTEVEAFSLMLSGYLMTEHQFQKLDKQHVKQGGTGTWGGFDVNAGRQDWQFLELEGIIGKPAGSSDMRRDDLGTQLQVGSMVVFKVWHLIPALRDLAVALACITVVTLIWFVITNWGEKIDFGSWTVASLVVGILLFGAGLASPALKWLNPQKAMQSWLMKFCLAMGAWIVTNIHVCIIDPIFLARGKLARLLKLPSK